MGSSATWSEAGAQRLRSGDPIEIDEPAFIGGEWLRPSQSVGWMEVHDSTTGRVAAKVRECSQLDVDAAVRAAADALPMWSSTAVEDRAEVLQAVSARLKARVTQVAEVVAIEVGMPVTAGRLLQVGLPRATFSNTAKALRSFEFELEVEHSLVVREPFGVVGAITPWNYPLHQIALKIAPALAAGNTVVLKPSEVAPISALLLTEILTEAGVPPGVVNVVPGRGVPVGEALASHPLVDMVSFTGSTAAGKRVAKLAADTVKKVTLELGGKSANILLDDADVDEAVADGLSGCFRNSGQTCTALSRMLVPRELLPAVEEEIERLLPDYIIGDPLDETTKIGPLVTAQQRDRVRTYIRTGLEEGARLVGPKDRTSQEDGPGYFVSPTVFSDVQPDMVIATEEIFGPVLCLIAYDDEDDAVAIANDSVYGLSGAVWSRDTGRAESVARRLRTGRVDINGAMFNVLAPFGGYKQSGLGREAGAFGLDEFLEYKSIQR